ncbi:hypothetical protein M0813_27460 [Anaeramoeba flamelloides]|nr:hypothetical protein M0813_27460 [Anaeramoeba flamelloides]
MLTTPMNISGQFPQVHYSLPFNNNTTQPQQPLQPQPQPYPQSRIQLQLQPQLQPQFVTKPKKGESVEAPNQLTSNHPQQQIFTISPHQMIYPNNMPCFPNQLHYYVVPVIRDIKQQAPPMNNITTKKETQETNR